MGAEVWINAFYKISMTSLLIGFFVVLVGQIFPESGISNLYLVEFPYSTIQNTINNFQGLNIISIISLVPSILSAVVQILIAYLINSINVIRFAIQLFLQLIGTLIPQLSNTTLITLLSWILVSPLLLAVFWQMALFVFYLIGLLPRFL